MNEPLINLPQNTFLIKVKDELTTKWSWQCHAYFALNLANEAILKELQSALFQN